MKLEASRLKCMFTVQNELKPLNKSIFKVITSFKSVIIEFWTTLPNYVSHTFPQSSDILKCLCPFFFGKFRSTLER